MDKERVALLKEIWHEQLRARDIINENEALPRRYGDMFLFQAEIQLMGMIAVYPDITITDIANILKKTPSACSQIVHRLCEKELVKQVRDENNKRRYHLQLTEQGERIYQDHAAFAEECQERTIQKLCPMSREDLQMALELLRKLNECYEEDVRRSREHFVS